MFFADSWLMNIITVLTTCSVLLILYSKWVYQYWTKKNVVQLKPRFPFGNVPNPLNRKETLGKTVQRFYEEFDKNGLKYGGIYTFFSPVCLILDIEYVKRILTKDFQHFTDRGVYYNEKKDPLSAHLFAIDGPKWRGLRVKLTPTFTSGKMKMMFSTFVNCTSVLEKKIDSEYKANNVLDIKEILACFTTDIIGSCAFGLECKSFEQENSPFRVYGKKIFQLSKFRALKTAFAINFADLSRFLGIINTPKDISAFFNKVVKDTVEYRETNNVYRKDFMQLLLELKNNDKSITMEELAAQCFVFFLAGFETSSTTMTFALYELASNSEIQNKARNEINAVLGKHNDEITYESVNDMKYLNQVIDETLRKYPPVPFLTRKCVKRYQFPDDGLVIEEGQRVFIPVLGMHYNEKYYPNPEKFDPDRFNEENKRNRSMYCHLPFGEGPRNCIGLRFGLLQSKVGLTSLLRKYKFYVDSKTKEPLCMDPKSFILSTKGGVWLNVEKIE